MEDSKQIFKHIIPGPRRIGLSIDFDIEMGSLVIYFIVIIFHIMFLGRNAYLYLCGRFTMKHYFFF